MITLTTYLEKHLLRYIIDFETFRPKLPPPLESADIENQRRGVYWLNAVRLFLDLLQTTYLSVGEGGGGTAWHGGSSGDHFANVSDDDWKDAMGLLYTNPVDRLSLAERSALQGEVVQRAREREAGDHEELGEDDSILVREEDALGADRRRSASGGLWRAHALRADPRDLAIDQPGWLARGRARGGKIARAWRVPGFARSAHELEVDRVRRQALRKRSLQSPQYCVGSITGGRRGNSKAWSLWGESTGISAPRKKVPSKKSPEHENPEDRPRPRCFFELATDIVSEAGKLVPLILERTMDFSGVGPEILKEAHHPWFVTRPLSQYDMDSGSTLSPALFSAKDDALAKMQRWNSGRVLGSFFSYAM